MIAGQSPRLILAALALTSCGTPSAGEPEAAPAAPVASATRPGTFAVSGVRVFDGETLHERATVLVKDGRIAAFGPDAVVPAGVEVIDGAGKTLMPGLIDGHVHAYAETARRDALRFGVTTELDMFADWHLLAAAKAERESLAATDQADLWSAGTLATAAGGHGTQFGFQIPTLAKPAEAQAWVDARIAEGSDYIKIVREDGELFTGAMPSLDDATAAALIAAAHQRKRRAVVHATTRGAARQSLEAGADGLVHAFQDLPADAVFTALAAKRGAFVVPTLSVIAAIAGTDHAAKLAADPKLSSMLSADQKEILGSSWPGASDRNRARLFRNAEETVRRLHANRVTILAGTDAPNSGTAHGASMHGELELLVAAGLSPAEALAAATSRTAEVFGLADRGRIAAGLRADLILVEGDPTREIRATRAIAAIWKNGHRVERVAPAAPDGKPTGAAVALGPISDFEGAEVSSRYGHGWEASTDERMGGKSLATIRRVAAGNRKSKGALEVTGEVKPGFAFPFAGCTFFPGAKPMQPADLSKGRELVFSIKGDPGTVRVLLLSSEMRGPPPMKDVATETTWREVRIPLADFAGADLTRVAGIAFTFGPAAGPFRFSLDDVAIR